MHRLLVSAAHKSSGKTTLSIGLVAALTERGRVVQPFKKGPDYIDPMWLARAAGRPCFNLDPYLMDDASIADLFAGQSIGADLALVEGNKGLYDGLALDGSNSNAAVARRLGLPVLLVIDARGMTRGIAPLILGYQAFDREVNIAGVILNRLGGSRHESKLRAVIEHYTDVPVLGAVAEDARLSMTERHLGLMPCAEVEGAEAHVREIGRIVAAQVDLGRVQALAAAAPPQPRTGAPAPAAPMRRADVRIGIARDRAFGFYYPDDLAALQAAGAELVPVDTLQDERLPAIDGLFIGGGFPETCMDALEANAALRGELRQAIAAGLPVHAECGGLMYLSRSITWQGRTARMVGAIPGDTVMHAKPVGRGYVHLQETGAMPWGTADGGIVRGHEFHHSSLENLDPGVAFAYRVRRGHGVDGQHDGVLVHNALASYAHLRSAAGSQWASRFVEFVRAQRARRVAHVQPAAVRSSKPAPRP
ncbi:MAG: cobyrinate a,c-diamide synthase [Ideonella sp.]|nr:cobyrinate a,c-diamide synthase [Ideonella sp.]